MIRDAISTKLAADKETSAVAALKTALEELAKENERLRVRAREQEHEISVLRDALGEQAQRISTLSQQISFINKELDNG